MFLLNKARRTLMDKLSFAIEHDQQGDAFVYELMRTWQKIPVPVLTDLGSKFLESLRDNREIIELLAQDKGRAWLTANLDDMLDCLLQLSEGAPERRL